MSSLAHLKSRLASLEDPKVYISTLAMFGVPLFPSLIFSSFRFHPYYANNSNLEHIEHRWVTGAAENIIGAHQRSQR